MNKGKVCVSLCAKSAAELLQQLETADNTADVIEVRLDCLDIAELDIFLETIEKNAYTTPLLATFRPTSQGGCRDISIAERIEFWQSCGKLDVFDFFDFEYDLPAIESTRCDQLMIRSFHDFESTPANLVEIYQRLAEKSDVVKIAVKAEDIADACEIWKLLEIAKVENRKIVPIAMGEPGKWTRILGLAHDAMLTYASQNSLSETAPGQVSVSDLNNVYRAKEIDRETEVFGILGSNTSVSMSPYIHNAFFKTSRMNRVFVPLQTIDLDRFIEKMLRVETREVELNFKGFSVTIPHKQSIIKHLDYLDETAKMIGAVNTVKIIEGKLHGFNTDARGFIEPLLAKYDDLNNVKVAVLGAGGGARAVIYSLKKEGADVTILARDLDKAEALSKLFQTKFARISDWKTQRGAFEIVVNTTPIGMMGKAEGETLLWSEDLKGVKLVYDLVYIPQETRLLAEAKAAGIATINGIEMLIAQAIEQQRIWTNSSATPDRLRKILLERIG